MTKYNRLAVFGGTFSPVHSGHVAAINAYAKAVKPDVLYIIPTAIPPHKKRSDGASDGDRMEMLRLALCDITAECEVVVSDIELKRGGKSYTINTVDELLCLADEVIIYCGTDMLLTLDKWYNYEKLLKSVSVAYMQREDDLRYNGEVAAKIKSLHESFGTEFTALPNVSCEISSSEIRRMIRDNLPLTGFIPEKVEEYIYKSGLYR